MKKQGKPGSEANQELTNPLKVVAGPTSANSDQSRTDVPPSAAGGQQDSSPAAHRATGPRTKAGKRRSSRNALKSGIFSGALPMFESPVEYKSLLDGLQEDLQSQGTLETVLVEKLAIVTWRERRLVEAENAEIEKSIRWSAIGSIPKRKVTRDENPGSSDEPTETQKLSSMLLNGLMDDIGKYEVKAAIMPSQDAMDRFIRYEAHLSREFDRILNQLDRVRRMRRGQPAPPTLRVELDR